MDAEVDGGRIVGGRHFGQVEFRFESYEEQRTESERVWKLDPLGVGEWWPIEAE
jgi:hypothetical protein